MAGTLALGIATNGVYDMLKSAVLKLRGNSAVPLTVRVVESGPSGPGEVSVTGRPAAVVDAIEALKSRGVIQPSPEDEDTQVMSHAAVEQGDGPGTEGQPGEGASTGPREPNEYCRHQVQEAAARGLGLLHASRRRLVAADVPTADLPMDALLDGVHDSDLPSTDTTAATTLNPADAFTEADSMARRGLAALREALDWAKIRRLRMRRT